MKHLTASIFRALFQLKPLKPTYFGFYQKVFKPLELFKGVKKKIVYRGQVTLLLDINDWIQQNLYFLNEYEEKEIKFLESQLKPGDVFIDVGANIGLYALLAGKIVGPSGKVYAFEPLKKNHDALLKHIRLNNAANIRLEKLAVSNEPGILQLHLNEAEGNNGMATAFSENFTSTETVPAVTLDSYFADNHDLRISLVKMDIEGAEYLALQGMVELLEKHKPALLIEIDPNILTQTPFSPLDIEQLLTGLGYRKYYLAGNGELKDAKQPEDRSHNYVFK